MTPEEARFNDLLARLKTSNPYPLTPFAETPADRLHDLHIAIWIMESKEIFYQGRLKGSQKTTAGKPQYNSHPIDNLETLVKEASLALLMWLVYNELKYTSREGPAAQVTGLFDRLLKSYDEMAQKISLMRLLGETTIKKTSILNTRKIIEGWKRKALKDIKPGIYEADIKNDLAKLFITHVPEAPSKRIAKCVSVLLSTPPFNVEVNIETFRKEVKRLKEDIELDNYI